MPAPSLRIRHLTIDRTRADAARRIVPASLSSEEPVRRGGEVEVLRHDAASVDLARARDGLPLLFCHDRTAPIGVVENVRLDGKRLIGDLRFGQSARASEVWTDVVDGVLRNVSISYSVDGSEPIAGGVQVTRWTLYEASVVSIPADATVGIGREAELPNNDPINGGTAMPAIVTREEMNAEIRATATRHGLPSAFADGLVSRSLTVELANREILNELARRDEESGGHLNVNPDGMFHHPERAYMRSAGELQQAQRVELMADALAARIGGPALRAENPYVHSRAVDMARDCLEMRGVRTTSMSPSQIVERALHATSDFPNLLTGTGQRILRQAYSAYLGGVKRACKPSTAKDFRAKQRLMLGEAPALLKVNEHGEFKSGSMAESKESYSLATFGRIFGITRQALINDDLDAFGDMGVRLGRAAAEFENQQLVTLLTSNPTMSDSVALFHATHANLGTGAGSALQLSALTAARLAMRLQKGLDGTTPIDATPRYLIVPAALETTGEQLLTAIMATQASNVNPFPGKLDLVVDPRLDVVSSTAWYLSADPALIDTLEYSYLESAEGPELFTEEGFDVDGVRMKVRLDFGAGALDWRGLYKANGA